MVKKVTEAVSDIVPAKPEADVTHPYAATDPIPVPEAVESDSDTTWALWEDLTAQQENGRKGTFADTVPSTLELVPVADKGKRRP